MISQLQKTNADKISKQDKQDIVNSILNNADIKALNGNKDLEKTVKSTFFASDNYSGLNEIFDSIVMQMQKQDSELAEQNEVPAEELSKVESQYKQITPAHFLAYSKEMFYHWTEDEFASNFRKMLTLEQYRDPEMCKLYHDYLGAGPRSYVKDILGVMGIKNPDAAATAFYGPMYLGYSLYDYAEDKEALKKQIFDAMDAAFASVTEELQ